MSRAWFMLQRASWMARNGLALGAGAPPPIDVNWSGPSLDLDGGGWTADVEDETPVFDFVSPSTNNGLIETIIPDGAGGYFIGGTWTSITDRTATTYTTG